MSVIYSFDPQYYNTPISIYGSVLREPRECYNGSARDPLDPEQQHQRDLERIRDFRLIDDDFMTVVFNDRESAELLIRIVLQRDDLIVTKVVCQNALKNLHGRSVRLDIYAEDSDGNAYNVEVQRDDKGAGIRRARYNSSLMDTNITDPGEDYDDLAETYVIFITEHDIFGNSLPIYHIDRYIGETGQQILDGSHIVYVNSQIRDNTTALGKLMHDFWCISHKDMNYRVLADRVRHFKTNEEEITSMCKELENMRREVAEAAAKAAAKVASEKAQRASMERIAIAMLARKKDSVEEIAEITGLTLQEVRDLAEQQPA